MRPARITLVLSYLAFISLGLPDGLIGVGWPTMRADFHVATASVGFLLFTNTVGYLTASVLSGFATGRVGTGWVLGGGIGLFGLALAGYAFSPSLPVTVVFALIAGLGGGSIDTGLNRYAARAFGPRHMNWLHAFFGLGVAISPTVMTVAIHDGPGWRWGYGIVSSFQLLLAVAFLVTVRSWTVGAPTAQESHQQARGTLALPMVWLGVLAFGIYVAIEVSTGLWAFLLLTEARGVDATVAGFCVSVYWGSLFVGRVVQGLLSERLGTGRVLGASIAGMAAGALLVSLPAPGWVTVAGLVVIGFSAAPVFPLLVLGTAERVGDEHADRTIGLQVAGAGLGGAVIPSLIGVLLTRVDVRALGPALLVLSVVLLALYAYFARHVATRRAAPALLEG
jgi:fucose permease